MLLRPMNGPFIAEVITDEYVVSIGDAVHHDPECRVGVEGRVPRGEGTLLICDGVQEGIGPEVPEEGRASVRKAVVAEQGPVDIGERQIVEQNDEGVAAVEISAQRHTILVLADWMDRAFNLNIRAQRQGQSPEGDPRLVQRNRAHPGSVAGAVEAEEFAFGADFQDRGELLQDRFNLRLGERLMPCGGRPDEADLVPLED